MNWANLQDIKSIHIHFLHFYTAKMNGQKEKLRNQSYLPL